MRALDAVELGQVGLVVAEDDLVGALEVDDMLAELGVVNQDVLAELLQGGFFPLVEPAPGVAKPELRQNMDLGRIGAAIAHRHLHQDVVGRRFGIFDIDVEIAVGVEDAGVDDLELRLLARAPRVLLHQMRIGKFRLGIFVEHMRVAVGRRRIEVVVELLDVLAVIALAIAEAEHPLLQDRVLAVPERQADAEALLVVAKPGDAILAPAIGAAGRMLMGEIAPGVAVGAVILAHRAPLALADIGPPFAPGLGAGLRLLQAQPFGIGLSRHHHTL